MNQYSPAGCSKILRIYPAAWYAASRAAGLRPSSSSHYCMKGGGNERPSTAFGVYLNSIQALESLLSMDQENGQVPRIPSRPIATLSGTWFESEECAECFVSCLNLPFACQKSSFPNLHSLSPPSIPAQAHRRRPFAATHFRQQ